MFQCVRLGQRFVGMSTSPLRTFLAAQEYWLVMQHELYGTAAGTKHRIATTASTSSLGFGKLPVGRAQQRQVDRDGVFLAGNFRWKR